MLCVDYCFGFYYTGIESIESVICPKIQPEPLVEKFGLAYFTPTAGSSRSLQRTQQKLFSGTGNLISNQFFDLYFLVRFVITFRPQPSAVNKLNNPKVFT